MCAKREIQSEASTCDWQSIESAPEAAAGVLVWVVGGSFEVPTLVPSDGEYWRFEATALPGNTRTPLLWHLTSAARTKPDMPSIDLLDAHRASVPANESADISQARQTIEELVPRSVTPLVYVGFLRLYHNESDNLAKARRIEEAMKSLNRT